jgi:hypothetical protein
MTPQYRIQQVGPSTFELDRASASGAWVLISFHDTQASAQNKMSDCITADAWSPPAPQFFDALGQAIAVEQK